MVSKNGRIGLLHHFLQALLKGHKSRIQLIFKRQISIFIPFCPSCLESDFPAIELNRVIHVVCDGWTLVIFHLVEHHLVRRDAHTATLYLVGLLLPMLDLRRLFCSVFRGCCGRRWQACSELFEVVRMRLELFVVCVVDRL